MKTGQLSILGNVTGLTSTEVGLGNLINELQLTASQLSTDGTMSADSATLVPSQSAVVSYVASSLGDLTGALIFKGTIDLSTNPNYPAGTVGDVYMVSVAGKIGGASGVALTAGDLILCITTNGGGTQASVGTDWTTVQLSINGIVVGPSSSTDGDIALFNGTSGAVIKDSGISISTDGTMASDSDALIPTQKAVVTYVASQIAGLSAQTPWTADEDAANHNLYNLAGLFDPTKTYELIDGTATGVNASAAISFNTSLTVFMAENLNVTGGVTTAAVSTSNIYDQTQTYNLIDCTAGGPTANAIAFDTSLNVYMYEGLSVNGAHASLSPSFIVYDSQGNPALQINNSDSNGFGDAVSTLNNTLDDGTGQMTVSSDLILVAGIWDGGNAYNLVDTTLNGQNTSAGIAFDPSFNVYINNLAMTDYIYDATVSYKLIDCRHSGANASAYISFGQISSNVYTFINTFLRVGTTALLVTPTEVAIDVPLNMGALLNTWGQGSAPGTPNAGSVYFDTSLHQIGYYNGTTWVYLGAEASQTPWTADEDAANFALYNLNGIFDPTNTFDLIDATNAGATNSAISFSVSSGLVGEVMFFNNVASLNSSGKLTVSAFEMPTGAASGYVLTSDGSGNGSWAALSGVSVTSFNSRTGAVTLESSDVTTALGYTPFNAANVSTDGTMGADSTTLVPTQSAVVTYVASQVAGYVSTNHIQRATFNDASLASGNVLVITHNLGLTAPYAVVVAIFDNTGNQIVPDAVIGTANSVDVDLASYGSISGTWEYVVVG